MARTRLTDDEIATALAGLPGWSRYGDAITKRFTFPTFAEAIAFVTRVAPLADAMDHHPDLDIRYNRVTCSLSTHDRDGVTELDVRLASQIEGVGQAE